MVQYPPSPSPSPRKRWLSGHRRGRRLFGRFEISFAGLLEKVSIKSRATMKLNTIQKKKARGGFEDAAVKEPQNQLGK